MDDLSNLQRTIKGVTLPYPIMIGGGIFKSVEHLADFAPTEVIPEWGSITTNPKAGNGGRDYYAHYENGTLQWAINSIGLTNPSMDYVELHAREMIKLYAGHKKPLAINVSGEGLQDSLTLLKRAVDCDFPIITFNAACPNRASDDDSGRPKSPMCSDESMMKEFIPRADAMVGKTRSLVMLKVSGNLSHTALATICGLLKGSSTFAGIVTGNTGPNGTAYLENGETAIKTANGLTSGGVSGPGLKPFALDLTRQSVKELGGTKAVWGCGGIMNVRDIHDYFRAGAPVVQMVTAFREANEDKHFIMSLLEELMAY